METGSWTFACEHCGESLADDSKYESPTCPTCHFHVHDECIADCPEHFPSASSLHDDDWYFACGHCAEALPAQTGGQQSPTCKNCDFHVHPSCFGFCPEEPRFKPLTNDYKIVRSTQNVNTRETRTLAELYPTTGSASNPGYRKLINTLGCIFLNDVSILRLSCGDELAWLNPYTGNQHNRCVFVQLVLAALHRDSVCTSFESHFYEAFLGSGQVFLNFNWCMGLLKTSRPRVIAGDLNVCLCCGWMGLTGQLGKIRTFLVGYLNTAVRLDQQLSGTGKPAPIYQSVRGRLNALLKSYIESRSLLDEFSIEIRREIAYLYIYLNNRCVNQSTYNLGKGTFSATFDPNKKGRLDEIRASEWNALCRASRLVSLSNLQFCHADFAVTTQSAGLGDLVIYDCPFPEFRIAIPSALEDDIELFTSGKSHLFTSPLLALEDCKKQCGMKGGGHYGGDEGGDLQLRILEDAVAKVQKGSSVVICNYATPTLLVWYRKLSIALYHDVPPIILFKRPQKDDQLYCLVVWPSDRVLAKNGKSARQYVNDRILAIYASISKVMHQKSSMSKTEIEALLDKGWQ